MGVQISCGKGTSEAGHVLAHWHLPTHECIVHCLPAATGECACKCMRRTNAFANVIDDKQAICTAAKLLLTLLSYTFPFDLLHLLGLKCMTFFSFHPGT